jgi:hypothetical protein
MQRVAPLVQYQGREGIAISSNGIETDRGQEEE